VIGAGVASAEGGTIQAAGFHHADYVGLWRQSDLCAQTLAATQAASTPSPELDDLVATHKQQRYASTWIRFYEVQKRYFVMHWRNAPTNLTRIMLLTIIGVMLGLIYLQISTADYQGVVSMLSVIFLGLAFPSSVGAASAFPSFFRQRAVYYRESTIGMYDYKIYSTAMFLVEIPYIFFALPFFLLPFYFMIGFAMNGVLFWKYYLVVFIMGMNYSSLSMLWMAIAPSQIAGNVMNGFFMSMFFMFGGLFIEANAIPVGWKWFYYIDPIPKALIATAATQFYCDYSSGQSCPKIAVPTDSGATVIQYTSDFIANAVAGNAGDYGKYIGYLFLTLALLRVLVLIAFKKVSHIKR